MELTVYLQNNVVEELLHSSVFSGYDVNSLVNQLLCASLGLSYEPSEDDEDILDGIGSDDDECANELGGSVEANTTPQFVTVRDVLLEMGYTIDATHPRVNHFMQMVSKNYIADNGNKPVKLNGTNVYPVGYMPSIRNLALGYLS